MNYVELHIGDYEKATAHLTACEDGMYGRLIRRYYDTEAPLPLDLKALQRLVRARSKDEKEAVETVLEEFFLKDIDGWRHKRCQEEIERYHEKRLKAQRSANARWNRCDGNANASDDVMRTHSEGNALQSPDTITRAEIERPATPAGEAAMAMRQAGCISLNQSNPDFLAALEEGVTPKELADAVNSCKSEVSGAGLFKYAVKVARTNHSRAAATITTPTARAGPPQGHGKTVAAVLALEEVKRGLDNSGTGNGLATAAMPRLGASAG